MFWLRNLQKNIWPKNMNKQSKWDHKSILNCDIRNNELGHIMVPLILLQMTILNFNFMICCQLFMAMIYFSGWINVLFWMDLYFWPFLLANFYIFAHQAVFLNLSNSRWNWIECFFGNEKPMEGIICDAENCRQNIKLLQFSSKYDEATDFCYHF